MESDVKSEKQETLESSKKGQDPDEVQKLRDQLKTAMDRVSMLEQGLELKTTSIQKVHKIDQDSLEIGAQATGRIKVYGDFGSKERFAAKLKDAFEVLEAAMDRQAKLNGNSKK